MRKTMFYCDRCGKLIENTAYALAVHYYDKNGDTDQDEGAELCFDCYNIVDKAIADLIKPPKQKEPIKHEKPHGGQNKARLDLGKIVALRMAGWSLEKIGDEMGCSAQTIANHLDEAMDFYSKRKGENEDE